MQLLQADGNDDGPQLARAHRHCRPTAQRNRLPDHAFDCSGPPIVPATSRELSVSRPPLDASDDALATGHRGLLDPLTYQHRPAMLAPQNLQSRILGAGPVGLGKMLELGIILSESCPS